MIHAKKYIAGMLLLGGLLRGGSGVFANPNCGDTIVGNVTLNGNLNCDVAVALYMDSGSSLNGSGFTISAQQETISIQGKNHVTIRNTVIQGTGKGIAMNGNTNYILIEGVEISGASWGITTQPDQAIDEFVLSGCNIHNSSLGIYAQKLNNPIFVNNKFINNTSAMLFMSSLTGLDPIHFSNNFVSGSTNTAITLQNLNITNSTIDSTMFNFGTNSGAIGIMVYKVQGPITIKDLRLQGFLRALSIEGVSNFITIDGLEILNSTYGIFVYPDISIDGLIITDNNIHDNVIGIYARGLNNPIIINNTIINNTYGISFTIFTGLQFSHNNVFQNGTNFYSTNHQYHDFSTGGHAGNFWGHTGINNEPCFYPSNDGDPWSPDDTNSTGIMDSLCYFHQDQWRQSYFIGLENIPRLNVLVHRYTYADTRKSYVNVGDIKTAIFNVENNLGRVTNADDTFTTPFHFRAKVGSNVEDGGTSKVILKVKILNE